MAVADRQGRSLLPRARKTRGVLAVLALAAPKPVLRSQLTALFWSQREKEQARASLRQALHELQQSLGPVGAHLVWADRTQLGMRRDEIWIDVQTIGREGGSSDQSLDLLRSTLLEDLGGLDPAFDRWLEQERRKLADVARAIGEGLLTQGRGAEEVLPAAERLVAIDPAHERAWFAIVRAHAERGDRAAALAAFDRCRTALAEASQLTPGRDLLSLIASIRGETPPYRGENAAPDPAISFRPLPSSRPISPVLGHTVRIGVTPFRSLHAEPQDPLAAGLTHEITTGLSRFRGIACIPIASETVDPTDRLASVEPDRKRNLDFLLEGTVQRSALKVRIIAQLIDLWAAGEVIWAHRFDLEDGDVLATQDDIAAQIVAQVDPRLILRQGERAAALGSEHPTPHEALLQAIPAVYQLDRDGFHAAGRLLREAVEQDPQNAPAHAWFAYWHLFLVGQGWADDPGSARARAADLARRAVGLDPGDARSLALAGHVKAFLANQVEEACTLHHRAITLNPNLALAWCFAGLARCYLGDHKEACRMIEQAARLSPYDPHLFFFDMALTMPHLLSGDYERAVEIGRRAIELNPGFTSSYKGQLAALGHLGRLHEAELARAALLDMEPGFSVSQAIARSPMRREQDRQHYAEGLRRAGLPE